MTDQERKYRIECAAAVLDDAARKAERQDPSECGRKAAQWYLTHAAKLREASL